MYAGGITSFEDFLPSDTTMKSEDTLSLVFADDEWDHVVRTVDRIKYVADVCEFRWTKGDESYDVTLTGTVRSRMRAIKLIHLTARSTPLEKVSVTLLDDDDMTLVYYPTLTSSEVYLDESNTLTFPTSDGGYVLFGSESDRAQALKRLDSLAASKTMICTFHECSINLPPDLLSSEDLHNLEIVSGCDVSFDSCLVLKSCRSENVKLCCLLLSQFLTTQNFKIKFEIPKHLSKFKFPGSAKLDGNFIEISGTCPEIAETLRQIQTSLDDLVTIRLKVRDAQLAADAAVREFPRLKNAHSLVAAKLEKSSSTLTLIGPAEVVISAAKIVPGSNVISRDAGNLNLPISNRWDSQFWEIDNFPESQRVEISRSKSIISSKIDLSGVCNAESVNGDLVSWDPRWVEISRSVISAIESGSFENLPVTRFSSLKKHSNYSDLAVKIFPTGDDVAIVGSSLLSRLVAFVRFSRSSDHLEISSVFPDLNREWLTFRIVKLSPDQIGFATGRDGTTREKIQNASGALIHFSTDGAIYIGNACAVQRADDYVNILTSQMDSSDRLSSVIKRRSSVSERSDVSVISVDGFNSKTLRSTEEATGTYCVFGRESRESKIYIFGWSPSRRARAVEMLSKAASDDSHSVGEGSLVTRDIAVRLPAMLQSRVLFQAGPDGQDPPAEVLERLLNAKLAQGAHPNQIKVKTNQSNLIESRKTIDEWIEKNMCCGTIKLPKFHNVCDAEMDRKVSDMSKRAWMSASTHKDGSITLVGENDVVNACMKELITWAAEEGMDVLTRLNTLERPVTQKKRTENRKANDRYSSDEASG